MSDLRTPADQRAYTGWRIASLRLHPSRRWDQGELADAVNRLMDLDYWTADRISTVERGKTRLPSEWVPAFAVVLGTTANGLLGTGTGNSDVSTGYAPLPVAA